MPPLEPPPKSCPRDVDATGDDEATGIAGGRPNICCPMAQMPAMNAAGSTHNEVVVDAADENDASAPMPTIECESAGVASL